MRWHFLEPAADELKEAVGTMRRRGRASESSSLAKSNVQCNVF